MKKNKTIILAFLWIVFLIIVIAYLLKANQKTIKDIIPEIENPERFASLHIVKDTISLGNYFEYMDSLVELYNPKVNYNLDEHTIVHSNSWIIDRLENTDYYKQKKQNVFIYDPEKMVIFSKGDIIYIPLESFSDSLKIKQDQTIIDINIPEYKLRIIEKDSTLYSFSIRVGRNEKKYLAMADREVDLRTMRGEGSVVRINREARYINPVNNKEYKTTLRDDKNRTLVPKSIPWIEPEINGLRYGQLIHPTTNPVTLGKAYSNGCIGLREADAWRLYYHAPLKTKVKIRYDLEIVNELGETEILQDIYNWKHLLKKEGPLAYMEGTAFEHEFCYCSPTL